MYVLEKLNKRIGLATEFPPQEIEADLAIPCFKKNPQQIAQKIKNLKEPLIDKVEIKGKYVNLILNKNLLAQKVITEIEKYKNKYGRLKNKRKTVIIEYSSPNIAKPMHVGHLRNTIIGNALKNIYQAAGYKTISINHLGDWGTQFGQLLLAWQKWGKKPVTIKKLNDLYIRINKKIKTDPQLTQTARDFFQKLEKGDKELENLWQEFKQYSVKDFKKIYKYLGVNFDSWRSESSYKNLAQKATKEALKKKIAVQEKGGPVIVDLEKYKLRSFLLQKADEATLYASRDLAAAQWRLKKYKPERILYVVGHEQELYFKQIFKTLKLLGYPAEKLEHISYNLVTVAGKKASTRAGQTISAENIIKEAFKKTKGNKVIGIGAIIYNTLSQRRGKAISFDWQKMLNLQGDSAPYIQYGYVRAQSILKKAKIKSLKKTKISILTKRESKLIQLLARYPEIIKQSLEANEPHLIAGYLDNLTKEFNRFYTQDPVIRAEEKIKRSRLLLVKSVAQVIQNGAMLLGIGMPERM